MMTTKVRQDIIKTSMNKIINFWPTNYYIYPYLIAYLILLVKATPLGSASDHGDRRTGGLHMFEKVHNWSQYF